MGVRLVQVGAALMLALLTLTAAARAEVVTPVRIAERVFLVPDKPGTPTQFQMIVLAGGSDEPDGECRGLAHYLEHLVLVGRNPEHADSAVRFFADASANGTTSMRATTYVHGVPARSAGPAADLERLFQFYAARLRDFTVSADDAVRERNVVLQEHDWRVGSSPFRRLERRLDRELLPDHPYGQWTIGTRDTIMSLTVAEAQAFHRSWYALNNVFFVIRSSIAPDELRTIADRTLKGLEEKRLPARPSARQPAIVVERKDLTETDRAVSRAGVRFSKLIRIDGGDTQEQRAARSLLLSYLRTRLPGTPHDVLVDQQEVANGTPSFAIERVAPKTYTLKISADVAPDVAPEALQSAIEGYVAGLPKLVISDELLARLKGREAAARANQDHDASAVYNRLVAWLAGRNKYEDLARWPERIAAVTPQAMHEALASLALPGRVVTGTLLPASDAPR